MKINHLKRYFIGIAMTAFLALLVGNAFGNAVLDKTASRDGGDGGLADYANNFLVVSPYWQVEGGSSYTFVAVSHSSLSGMASVIGVKMNAITSAGSAYDTAESFTIRSGQTTRVFIVPTNHATINTTAITDAVFLSGTTDFTYGHIRVNPVTSHPMLRKGGAYGVSVSGQAEDGAGFRDTTMLTYWGSVIIEAQTTGFAMEFIGDMNDSQSLGKYKGFNWGAGAVGAAGKNKYYASGVNLQ
ncbi:hypothetical protein M1N16_04005 [Nitrospinaceae bacterium]|nr:hypothetical protein [Nitrospinaceae bacterium]